MARFLAFLPPCVQRSSPRGVVSPSQERTVPGYSGRCLPEASSASHRPLRRFACQGHSRRIGSCQAPGPGKHPLRGFWRTAAGPPGSAREGQGCKRPYSSWHFSEQKTALLWVALFAELLYAPLVVPNPLGQRGDGLNHIFEGLRKFRGQPIGNLLVETLCRALGKPGPEGLETLPRTLG